MVTIYDLLEIDEDALDDEIERAYRKLVLEYRQDPSFSAEKNEENEMITNKLKIAYEILSDKERRKKYDNDLAKKRAEDLLKKMNNNEEKKKQPEQKEDKYDSNEIVDEEKSDDNDEEYDDGDEDSYSGENEDVLPPPKTYSSELTKEEKKKLKKAAEEEFRANLERARKAEETYNKAYNDAYDNYFGGVKSFPTTIKSFFIKVICLFVILLVFYIMFKLPPVKNALNDIYESVPALKVIVDMFKK